MGYNMQVDSELLQVCARDLVRVNNKDDLVEFPWGIGHRRRGSQMIHRQVQWVRQARQGTHTVTMQGEQAERQTGSTSPARWFLGLVLRADGPWIGV